MFVERKVERRETERSTLSDATRFRCRGYSVYAGELPSFKQREALIDEKGKRLNSFWKGCC